MNNLKQWTIGIGISSIMAILLLSLFVFASKSVVGQELITDKYITKNYCVTANLDKTDANKCKNKHYTAVIKKTPQNDMSYIDLDLLDRFEAGKLGTKNIDPKCKKNCVQTLEVYELIDQMNKYIKNNGFYVSNETPNNRWLKLLINKMQQDKADYVLSVK